MMIKEIKFTDNALKQINAMLSKKDKGSFFRIAIKGGGCSGFQYDFSFDKKPQNEDIKYENILITVTYQCLLLNYCSRFYFVSQMTTMQGTQRKV